MPDMIPDWAKELVKTVPGMVVLGVIMYLLMSGAMKESVEQNRRSMEALGEARGIMRWCSQTLNRVNPCDKPD